VSEYIKHGLWGTVIFRICVAGMGKESNCMQVLLNGENWFLVHGCAVLCLLVLFFPNFALPEQGRRNIVRNF
jgi:hypothetical protein